VIPWFVVPKLKAPLGDRALHDATTSKRVEVVNCGKDPNHPWCVGVSD
jgi:hypothetical protein